jgi:hypothetical protein
MTIERRPFGQSFAFRRGGMRGLGYTPHIAQGPSMVDDLGINVDDPYYGGTGSTGGTSSNGSSNWLLLGGVVLVAFLLMSGDK